MVPRNNKGLFFFFLLAIITFAPLFSLPLLAVPIYCIHPSTPPPLLLRGTIVNRTYVTHKNLYIRAFVLTIFSPINYVPP